jgi:hypothetical protein
VDNATHKKGERKSSSTSSAKKSKGLATTYQVLSGTATRVPEKTGGDPA